MEQAEFRSFYVNTAPRLRMYVARVCGSVDLANRIVQEVYLRFLCGASLPTDNAVKRAYLYGIADSLIIDNFRRLRRENTRMLANFFNTQRPDQDFRYDVRRAFSRLKPQQRSLLWLAYVEGFDHHEIA